jgi:UDP-2-acetamido-2,6-beta-L-arabino-hexul-4-ose reductase
MTNNQTIDLSAERVEHLLLRHEELARTNDLLRQQVSALAQERDGRRGRACCRLLQLRDLGKRRARGRAKSKWGAEQALHHLANDTGNPCVIFRLPGVFGKWCKPNYNSVVATYCHNIARGMPININDEATLLRLVYIDDVVAAFIKAIEATQAGCVQASVEPEYHLTLGELARQIQVFSDSISTLTTARVGTGLLRALYATYISYLPAEKFTYPVPQYADERGVFVEMLKTQDSGQFSYFTSHPGVTRGGHYHHSKSEKFLVIKGEAHFRFRHLLTNEFVEIKTNGSTPQVVDTIPGWSHDITNVGKEEMVVMIWANEIFIRHEPDTVASKV